jgi:hypothetical protein
MIPANPYRVYFENVDPTDRLLLGSPSGIDDTQEFLLCQSEILPPKQPPADENRQIGVHQSEREAATKPNGVTHLATMTKAETLATKM